MPTNSTRRFGATTSRMPLPAAAAISAALGREGRGGLLPVLCGRADKVAARLFIRQELDQAFAFGFLEQIGEGAKAVVGLVETGLSALQGLLDHRAPDAFVLAALGNERVQRLDDQVESFLLL